MGRDVRIGSVKGVALLAALALVAAVGASASPGRTLGGYGVSVSLPAGWHGLARPGQLQAADFPLEPRVLGSPELARVPRGHVHLVVWDYGPWVPYLPKVRRARTPLTIGVRDLTAGPLEGFPAGDAYAVRTVTLAGETLEFVADLGPKPLDAIRIRTVNRVLGTLRVRAPRVLPARKGRLAADGLALRLLPGWSGRVAIPANRHAARIVLRVTRGDIHVDLLELPGGRGGRYARLPIVLTGRDIIRRGSLLIARRVFSTGGRSFDLSVTVTSPRELRRANRLLATMAVKPKPWTFRSCDLTLRLPGTWRAAINPRSGCYPVITLRTPGLRVVLTELRPTEHASGSIVRRSGRRFQITVTPASARAEAAPVLATLRATRRS